MKMKPTITVADNGNLQIHIPMLIRRMRGRKTVIAPQALDGEITGAQEPVQSAILQALARGFSWADILESGQIKSISELARTLDVEGSYVARILKLTTLAPDIVEALINGEEPNGLSLAKLTQAFPEDWTEQRRQFGFATDWRPDRRPLQRADHQRRLFYFRGQETVVDHVSFHGQSG